MWGLRNSWHQQGLALMSALCGAGPGVVNVYINYEKKFAFVEFRTGAMPAGT